MNTFGAVLIKYDSSVEKGREPVLRDFLASLKDLPRKHIEGDVNDCTGDCNERNNNTICQHIGVKCCASLTGYFDFLLILKTQDIECLEKFVLSCLKGGKCGKYIAETQTLAGAYFMENDD